MKGKILELLQTRFEGVDEKTLERVAAKVAKTLSDEAGDDEIKTAANGVSVGDLMAIYGDVRATEAQKTAVSNYEKKHGLKNGEKVASEPDPNAQKAKSEDDDAPAWAKSLTARLDAMEKSLGGYREKETATARRARLDEMLKDAPGNVRKMYDGTFSAMKFEDDDAFEAWAKATKPVIEGLVNDYNARGAVSHTPRGGAAQATTGNVNPVLKAQVDAAAKNQTPTGKQANFMGLPTNG